MNLCTSCIHVHVHVHVYMYMYTECVCHVLFTCNASSWPNSVCPFHGFADHDFSARS